MGRMTLLVLSCVAVGCGGTTPCPEFTAGAQNGAASEAGTEQAPPRRPAPAAVRPDGFVAMRVAGVGPSMQGMMLLLADEKQQMFVPILIGETEAMVIDLRLRGEELQRPLTHDLLDRLVEALGGEVVMVEVNKLRDGIFVGSVFVWDGRELRHIDARASDSVAVALGHDVPIYVAQQVVDETGVPAQELLGTPATP